MSTSAYDVGARGLAGAPTRSARPPARRFKLLPTVALVAGAIYCLLPVLWVFIALTKTRGELFSTDTFLPSFGPGLFQNLSDLSAYEGGRFWRWGLNSIFYAGVGSGLSAVVSALAGYGLAKYRFRGRNAMFNILLAGVLMPQIILAIPQYLLLAKVGLAGTYWSVLLPSIISPFGIYLCRVYAASSVPTETLEAGRIDGAGELRLFRSIALPMMGPALVTVFLLQFVASWNNFLLPYIMLSDGDTFPLTTGLFTMLNQGAQQPALYSLVIAGVVISIIPLIALFLTLQRYWRIDLISGGLKG
jgi:multiple sugar transport system permease protein